MLQVLAFVHVL